MIAAIKLKVASDAQINQQVGVTIALAPKMCMQVRKVRRDFVRGPEPLRSCLFVPVFVYVLWAGRCITDIY